jgi:hypothetical protein
MRSWFVGVVLAVIAALARADYQVGGGALPAVRGGTPAAACAIMSGFAWEYWAPASGVLFYRIDAGKCVASLTDGGVVISNGPSLDIVDCTVNSCVAGVAGTGGAVRGWLGYNNYSAGGGGGASSVTLVPPDILNISPEGGAQIAGAVAAIWAVGLAFALFLRTIRETDGNSSTLEKD